MQTEPPIDVQVIQQGNLKGKLEQYKIIELYFTNGGFYLIYKKTHSYMHYVPLSEGGIIMEVMNELKPLQVASIMSLL
jgi:hypothetical protein